MDEINSQGENTTTVTMPQQATTVIHPAVLKALEELSEREEELKQVRTACGGTEPFAVNVKQVMPQDLEQGQNYTVTAGLGHLTLTLPAGNGGYNELKNQQGMENSGR